MPKIKKPRQDGGQPGTIVVASDAVQTATVDPNSTKLLFNDGASSSQPAITVSVSLDPAALITSTTRPTTTTEEPPPEETDTSTPTPQKSESHPISMGTLIGVIIAVVIGCLCLLVFFCWKRKRMAQARARARDRKRQRASSFVGSRDPKIREAPWEEFKSGPDSLQEPFPGMLPSPSTVYTADVPRTYVQDPPTSPKRAATIKSIRVNPSNNFAVGPDEDDDDERSMRLPLSPTSGRVQFRDNIQQKYGNFNSMSMHSDQVMLPPPMPLHRDGPASQPTPKPKRTMTLLSHKVGNNPADPRSKENNMIALHNIIAALDHHDHSLPPRASDERRASIDDYSNHGHTTAMGQAVDPFQDPEFMHNMRQALPTKHTK